MPDDPRWISLTSRSAARARRMALRSSDIGRFGYLRCQSSSRPTETAMSTSLPSWSASVHHSGASSRETHSHP